MQRCLRLLSRIAPNIFVLGFGIGLGFCSVFVQIDVIAHSRYSFLFVLNLCITVFLFLMWLWCWGITIAGDPGRTEDDLKKRGVLSRIKYGDIPNCLRHLPVCPKCHLPMPKMSMHCEECGCCVLRMDHHCGVTGQCVGDKNFKAFILSFMYSSLYSLSMAPSAFYEYLCVGNYDVIPIITMIYSPLFFVMLALFGASFLANGSTDIAAIDKINGKILSSKVKRFIKTFGNTTFEKILPLQRHTTSYAWPDVNWNEEDIIPL